jgi:undecaprenyl-diphosphatase
VNSFTAVLLGIIQGLTEFLPISSTAHLTLAGKILGLVDVQHPEAWTAFMAVMQLGTLSAVIAYFFRDVASMASSLAKDLSTSGKNVKQYTQTSRAAINIALGTLPVVIIGVLFRNQIEGAVTKGIPLIAASLIILALLLWVAEKRAGYQKSIEQVTIPDAILIGCAQVFALIPGSSRSGTTITAGLFLDLKRGAAARFSFLLSIPAVFASGVYEMLRIQGSAFQLGVGNLIVATVVSAVTGYAAIHWLLRFLQFNTTMVFVWYRLALGLLILSALATGLLHP